MNHGSHAQETPWSLRIYGTVSGHMGQGPIQYRGWLFQFGFGLDSIRKIKILMIKS